MMRSHFLTFLLMIAFGTSCCEAQLSLFLKSPLQKAIDRGLQPGGDLRKELDELEDVVVEDEADAKAVVRALKALPLPLPDAESTDLVFGSAEFEVTALFQQVESAESAAFPILVEEGLPELERVFRKLMAEDPERAADDGLFMIKILAMYGTEAGAQCVIDAAKAGVGADEYMWDRIFSYFADEHPFCELVTTQLAEPLPQGFIGVTFLDLCNSQAGTVDGFRHPFNTPAGFQALQSMLSPGSDQSSSYAHSAAIALPFLDSKHREPLLKLAMVYPDQDVQLAAAFASAKLKHKEGLETLVRKCLDIQTSDTARKYLKELNQESQIPRECQDPAFLARAEFARWLAHPNELAEAPDEVTVIDRRMLKWPGESEPKEFFLLSYRLKSDDPLSPDDEGVGLVGSVTWCFFDDNMRSMSPDDCYAIHCAWEARHKELIVEPEQVSTLTLSRFEREWKGVPIEDPEDWVVYTMRPGLKYPLQTRTSLKQIAAARAASEGKPGFAVFDGTRSHWYDASAFAEDTTVNKVLDIHAGRVILELPLEEKRPWKTPAKIVYAPEFIVEKYEVLLTELASADLKRRVELLTSSSPLSEHFEKYLDAAASIQGNAREEILTATYEKIVAAAESLPEASAAEALDTHTPVHDGFEAYVATVAADHPDKVSRLITLLEPRWDHNLGRTELAKAAWKARLIPEARRLLEAKVAKNDVNSHLDDQMQILAEIRKSDGKSDQAKELLIAQMRQCESEIEETDDEEEKSTLLQAAKSHVAKYRELFGDAGEKELQDASVPSEFLE